jgi:hypothetical protein
MSQPELWPVRPFLPLVRRKPGCEEEYGVLYDLFHSKGQTGYSATVFLTNVFLLPATESEFLALPKEIYDTVDEVYASGWRID